MLDEHGAVLVTVQGLLWVPGYPRMTAKARVLRERLLTIEWQQRELPEPAHTEAGTWLLINTSATRTWWQHR